MSDPLTVPPPMSAETYLEWHRRQDERYEYVDGAPCLKHATRDGARLMVGATQAHQLLSGNVYALLRERLRNGRCRPVVADGKVLTPRGNYRYPDVAVDCGPFDPSASVLGEPTLVVEIWSRSTHWIDISRKLADYRAVDSIRAILFLAQERPYGQLWTRDGHWRAEDLDGIDAEVFVPALGLTLPFQAIYDGLDFG